MKLRRGLGKGKNVPPEELAKRLLREDHDGDGALTKEEFATFLRRSRVGGPWFCKVVALTLWRVYTERWGEEPDRIPATGLARVLNYSMASGPRPTKRYVIEPEVVQGLKPPQTIDEYRASLQQEADGQPGEDNESVELSPDAAVTRQVAVRSEGRRRPRGPRAKKKVRRPGAKPRR